MQNKVPEQQNVETIPSAYQTKKNLENKNKLKGEQLTQIKIDMDKVLRLSPYLIQE